MTSTMEHRTRGCRDELWHNERGGSALEIAVVLPIFFLLLFGLFSFSIVLFGYGNATFASRAGVRYASLHSATSASPCTSMSVQNVVIPYLWAAPVGGVTVTTTWTPSNIVGGTVNVRVSVTYPVGPAILSAGQVTVSSTAMRTIAH